MVLMKIIYIDLEGLTSRPFTRVLASRVSGCLWTPWFMKNTLFKVKRHTRSRFWYVFFINTNSKFSKISKKFNFKIITKTFLEE